MVSDRDAVQRARGAGRKMGAQQLAGHAASRGGRSIQTSLDIKRVFPKLQCSLSVINR